MATAIQYGSVVDSAQHSYVQLSGHVEMTNTGDIAGRVGAHIIIQEKQAIAEVSVVEIYLRPSDGQAVVFTRDMKAVRNDADPRRRIAWQGHARTINPGGMVQSGFFMQVGCDLLEGMTNLDVVVIVDRLDYESGGPLNASQGKGEFERRYANAFGVKRGAAAGGQTFNPQQSGSQTFLLGGG